MRTNDEVPKLSEDLFYEICALIRKELGRELSSQVDIQQLAAKICRAVTSE